MVSKLHSFTVVDSFGCGINGLINLVIFLYSMKGFFCGYKLQGVSI
uniref:Uncharacterized protein n=1 Tax=Rhizophora mucronata TaxID=61149 RepID=A0A2P2PX87_RHIMU